MPPNNPGDLDDQEVEDMARRLYRLGSTMSAASISGLLLLAHSVRADAFRKWESLPERTREWYRDDARRALAKRRSK